MILDVVQETYNITENELTKLLTNDNTEFDNLNIIGIKDNKPYMLRKTPDESTFCWHDLSSYRLYWNEPTTDIRKCIQKMDRVYVTNSLEDIIEILEKLL